MTKILMFLACYVLLSVVLTLIYMWMRRKG